MFVSTVAQGWSLKKIRSKTRQKFHISGGLGINWQSNSRRGEWEFHRQAWDPVMQVTKTESLQHVCITWIDGLPTRGYLFFVHISCRCRDKGYLQVFIALLQITNQHCKPA